MVMVCYQRQGRRIPPSSRQVVPVAQGFSMMACETLANSSACPSLPAGIWVIMCSRAFFCRPSPMGVWKTPGAMPMTLILYFPRSLARGSTMPLTAPLLAAQMVCPRCPSQPATLLTTIIAPRSPSTSGCSDIIFAASLATLKVPTTLIWSTLYISSVEATPLEQMMVPAVTTPAQCTTALTFPKVFLVNSNSCFTLYSLTTSTLKNGVFSSLEMSLPKSEFMSAITTFAPRLSSSFTVARPNPDEPPVTTATKLPSIFIQSIIVLLHHRGQYTQHTKKAFSQAKILMCPLSVITIIRWPGQSRQPARLQPKKSLGNSLSPRRSRVRQHPCHTVLRSHTGSSQARQPCVRFVNSRRAPNC